MRKHVDIKQELKERVSSLELAIVMLLNTLRRSREIEIDSVKYRVLDSITDKELDVIENIITRPSRF